MVEEGGVRCLAATFLLALVVAGCGSTSGPTGQNRPAGTGPNAAAYDQGFNECQGARIDELAGLYSAYGATADPKSIAKAVGQATPGPPETQEAAEKGCLDALEA